MAVPTWRCVPRIWVPSGERFTVVTHTRRGSQGAVVLLPDGRDSNATRLRTALDHEERHKLLHQHLLQPLLVRTASQEAFDLRRRQPRAEVGLELGQQQGN